MALINCPDCLTPVSDQAVSCIKCGRPIRRDTQKLELKNYYHSCLPGIKQGMVLLTACLLGVIGKLISLSITVPDLLDRYSLVDIGKNVITGSGMYVVFAFMALLVIINYRWVSWLNEIFPLIQSPIVKVKSSNYFEKDLSLKECIIGSFAVVGSYLFIMFFIATVCVISQKQQGF